MLKKKKASLEKTEKASTKGMGVLTLRLWPGTSGNAVMYMTRNQALKKLQLKLSEFRRLCILKGIHPREPRKKPAGQHKTYYHAKDIAYLLHEPLLKKARELAAYEKKVRRARHRKNRQLAVQLAERRPTYRLDHLVRERYPSFVDAVRDLDDPLTLTHLFAVLPAEALHGIPPERVALARRLALEWQAWLVRARALRKVFVSVKGYYYQAEVAGQAVTWLVPHQLSQVLPADVDYKVMLTFLEFYQTLLQFVLFKLYHSLQLRYPPVLDSRLEEAAAGLEAIMHDLAAGGQGQGQQQRQQQGQQAQTLPAAAGEGAEEGEPGEEGAAGPDAQERLASLSAKVAELEAEIRGDRPRKQQQESGAGAAEDEGEEGEGSEEEFEIDSGDEQGSEEDEEGSEGEESDEEGEEEMAGDPTDADISAAGQLQGGSEGAQAAAEAEAEEGEDEEGTSERQLLGGAVAVDADDDAAVCASLFKGLVFFLGREVPREQLLLVIRAFGGEAGWQGEGSPLGEADERITHQVVDRPTQGHRFLSREYVQPQWVFDSANFRVLAQPLLYAPGAVPPPHLSPFVNEDEEGYVPEYGQQLKQLQEAAKRARRRHAGALAHETFVGEEGQGQGQGAQGPTPEDEAEAAEARYAAELARELKAGAGAEAEAAEAAAPAATPKRKREAEPADEQLLKDIMMTRKNKKLYQSLQKSKAAKQARVEQLQAKAQQLGKRG